MATIELKNDHTKIKWKNINNVARKAILNEGSNRTRILYAGPHPQTDNVIVMYRIIELLRGKYLLEETNFNTYAKSVHTTLTTINKEHFEKFTPPKQLLHEMQFHPDANIIAGTSYSRQLNDSRKSFFNNMIQDLSKTRGYMGTACDYYLKWRMRHFLNKRI